MEWGTVNFNGIEIVIMQQPYISDYCHHHGQFYTATGQDAIGNNYEIAWPVINEDCEDESEACDWDDFKVRKL